MLPFTRLAGSISICEFLIKFVVTFLSIPSSLHSVGVVVVDVGTAVVVGVVDDDVVVVIWLVEVAVVDVCTGSVGLVEVPSVVVEGIAVVIFGAEEGAVKLSILCNQIYLTVNSIIHVHTQDRK